MKRLPFSSLRRELGSLGQELEQRTRTAARASARFGQAVLRENAPHAFGDLAKGIEVRTTMDGAAIALTAPHTVPVNSGSRPHTPPLEPLKDWVRLRLDLADEAEIERVAFAIQRKIATEGTEPTFFIEKSMPAIEEYLEFAMREVLRGSRQ
jgi:hypothetical protein